MIYYIIDGLLLLFGLFLSITSGSCIYIIYAVGLVISHHMCEFHRSMDAVFEAVDEDVDEM